MEQCRAALTVQSEWIDLDRVVVAEIAGDISGVAAIAPDGPDFEITLFFVEPSLMGKGVGRVLWHALLKVARKEQTDRLIILSDPNAVAFYRHMGVRVTGSHPSDAIVGRTLPLLEFHLTD